MALRDEAAGEMPAPVVIVTLRTAQVYLTLALGEQFPPRFDERLEPLIVVFNRNATRLPPDIGSERKQLLAQT